MSKSAVEIMKSFSYVEGSLFGWRYGQDHNGIDIIDDEGKIHCITDFTYWNDEGEITEEDLTSILYDGN